MEKYFVNYNQSLALKELGFDEDCLGRWLAITEWEKPTGEIKLQLGVKVEDYDKNQCLAPLKSQVFEWFRKNHLLGHEINCPFISYSGKLSCIKNEGRYELYITDEEQLSLPEDIFYSTDYFEAESKAIDKLIELVKNK